MSSPIIETDAYGPVPKSLYNLAKRNNVSPADFWDLQDEHGRYAWEAIAESIRLRSQDPGWEGCYRAPWPVG